MYNVYGYFSICNFVGGRLGRDKNLTNPSSASAHHGNSSSFSGFSHHQSSGSSGLSSRNNSNYIVTPQTNRFQPIDSIREQAQLACRLSLATTGNLFEEKITVFPVY
jgi:hypothetical protein